MFEQICFDYFNVQGINQISPSTPLLLPQQCLFSSNIYFWEHYKCFVQRPWVVVENKKQIFQPIKIFLIDICKKFLL